MAEPVTAIRVTSKPMPSIERPTGGRREGSSQRGVVNMSSPEFVDADTWAAARADLLAAEKRLTAGTRCARRRRRAMPWREITADYTFDGADGTVTLAELFGRPINSS